MWRRAVLPPPAKRGEGRGGGPDLRDGPPTQPPPRFAGGRRTGALVLCASVLALGQTRGDESDRPPWIDEKTWAKAVDALDADARATLVKDIERARRSNALRSLVELERMRRGSHGPLDTSHAISRLLDDPELTALHAVAFANQTDPRLTGQVLRIGAEGAPANLRLAMGRILPGDTVLLPAGRDVLDFTLRGPRRAVAAMPLADVALIGTGTRKTTLWISPRRVQPIVRLRLEDCTLDLAGRPFEVTGSWIHLRRCDITNFRTWAFHGDDAVLLLEDCTFDGQSFSSSQAFELTGQSLVFGRRVTFKNMGTLARATPIFPCAFLDSPVASWLADCCAESDEPVFLCRSRGLLRPETEFIEFERATDDEDFIASAAGEKPAPDARSARIAGLLDLPRSVPYWIGLLRDARPSVRALAARRLEKLTGEKPRCGESTLLADETLAAALLALDAEDWGQREDAERTLEAAGKGVVGALEVLARTGTAEQKDRARALLSRIADRESVGNEPEAARLLAWLEGARDRLAWDEEKGRWVERDFK